MKKLPDIAEGEKIISDLLKWLGVEETSSTKDTPKRVAKMYLELFEGMYTEPPKVTTFESPDTYVCVTNIDFTSFCFPRRSFVTTINGAKDISKIIVGESLVTRKGDKTVTTKVTSVKKRKVKDLVQLCFSNNKKFACTLEHPIYSVDKDKWVDAINLNIGEKVVSLKKGYISTTKKAVLLEKGYYLGYYLGAISSDGSITRNAVRLEVNSKEFAEKFSLSLKKCFGRDTTVEQISKLSGFRKEDITQYRVRLVSGKVVNITDELFGCRKKTFNFGVPKIVFEDFEIFKGYLDGYLDGDGYRHKDEYININSKNDRVLNELAEVFNTKVFPHKWGFNYIRKAPRKIKASFDNYVKGKTFDTYSYSDYEVVFVTKKELKSHKQGVYVYSLECEKENPTFLVSGILVHNCEHHILPFTGSIGIVYHSKNDKVIGLSKLARIARYWAARPQLQERLGDQIATDIMERLQPEGVFVVISATHSCMSIRGVKAQAAITNTATLRGNIDKDEALKLLKGADYFSK